jgi:hypothetical protein
LALSPIMISALPLVNAPPPQLAVTNFTLQEFIWAKGCVKNRNHPPKAVRPVRQRKLVDAVCGEWDVSIRRACRLLEFDTSTYHYKSRRPGRGRCDMPITSHGYPRQAHRSCLALAKRLRRETDWIDPARVHRSCGRLRRGAFAPDPAVIRALLQYVEDASITGQGRSHSSGDRALWRRRGAARTRWTSPPILQNLVFGTHSPWGAGLTGVCWATIEARPKVPRTLADAVSRAVAVGRNRHRFWSDEYLRQQANRHR